MGAPNSRLRLAPGSPGCAPLLFQRLVSFGRFSPGDPRLVLLDLRAFTMHGHQVNDKVRRIHLCNEGWAVWTGPVSGLEVERMLGEKQRCGGHRMLKGRAVANERFNYAVCSCMFITLNSSLFTFEHLSHLFWSSQSPQPKTWIL